MPRSPKKWFPSFLKKRISGEKKKHDDELTMKAWERFRLQNPKFMGKKTSFTE